MKPRSSFAPRFTLAVFLALGAVLALGGGCSRQSEGERCSLDNGDEDCDSGLICVAAAELQSSDVSRCCPEDGGTGACTPLGSGSGSGGGSGTGGGTGLGGESATGGGAGSSGADEGAACVYNSDCASPLACVGGKCRVECITDRDCDEPLVCNAANRCVSE